MLCLVLFLLILLWGHVKSPTANDDVVDDNQVQGILADLSTSDRE